MLTCRRRQSLLFMERLNHFATDLLARNEDPRLEVDPNNSLVRFNFLITRFVHALSAASCSRFLTRPRITLEILNLGDPTIICKYRRLGAGVREVKRKLINRT
jgi:hypothetical protein